MRSLSLIGMSKNSGKTTVLNALLKFYSRQGLVMGLTSIGRDGEDKDVLTQTDKPEIYVNEGTIIATSLFGLCDITREILKTTGINTPLGEVIIMRAKSDGYVQLSGPSINVQLVQMIQALYGFGAQTVIVDGAFSRKTLASPAVTDHTILCTGAALSPDMSRVIEETVHVHELLKSEKISDELKKLTEGHPLALVKFGQTYKSFEQAALTDLLVNDLVRQGEKDAIIVAEDASKFLINMETHRKLLLRNIKLMVRYNTNLTAVTINPVSPFGYEFDAGEFRKVLTGTIGTPVINVMEEEDALYDLLV